LPSVYFFKLIDTSTGELVPISVQNLNGWYIDNSVTGDYGPPFEFVSQNDIQTGTWRVFLWFGADTAGNVIQIDLYNNGSLLASSPTQTAGTGNTLYTFEIPVTYTPAVGNTLGLQLNVVTAAGGLINLIANYADGSVSYQSYVYTSVLPIGPTGFTGATGEAGATGPEGQTGATGPTGANGPTGTIIYSGTGAPSGALGNVGDFYIDLANGLFYGPKQ
jgi:hypothetical protein